MSNLTDATVEKRLAKIDAVSFGYGGYQDAQFGLSVTLSGQGWGVGDFKGMWGIDTKVGDHTKWSEADRDREFASVVRFVNQLCMDAKVSSVDRLKGIPVEVEFEGNLLRNWRILKEVL